MTKAKRTKEQTMTYTTQKTTDRGTRIPPKTGSKLRCLGRVGNSSSTRDTRRFIRIYKLCELIILVQIDK